MKLRGGERLKYRQCIGQRGGVATRHDGQLALCGEHRLCQFNMYRRWFSDAGDDDAHGDEVTDPSVLSADHYYVGTPDDILAAIQESQLRLGYEELVFWARPPGMPAEHATASLELIAKHVLPALHETAAVSQGGSR